MSLFKTQSPTFKAPPPQTPFDRAAGEWDTRIGTARQQAANWRLMAFAMAALAAGAVGAYMVKDMTTPFVTYIVRTGPDGQPGLPEEATAGFNPNDTEISFVITEWIRWTRSKSTDEFVIRDNWNRAYKFLTPKTSRTFNQYNTENSPLADVGKHTRTLEMRSTPFRRSADTFEVRWRETNFHQGAKVSVDNYTALFTVLIRPPKDRRQLHDNPLGVYFDDITWSKDR